MLSQPERNALARELGMGPEACPQAWNYFCPSCNSSNIDTETEHDTGGINCWCHECGEDWHGPHYPDTLLPCPLSDDPAACLWDGAFMRALGLPSIVRVDHMSPLPKHHFYMVAGRKYMNATPTAALYAAWKEMRG